MTKTQIPGPWRLKSRFNTRVADKRPAAVIRTREGSPATAAVNSRLNDAAPIMFEALQEARTQVAILQERLGIKDSGFGTLSIIDAALEKATGARND